jgi:dienelactone hydrolase
MKSIALLALASAVALAAPHAGTTGGSGPYTSYYFEDATLPNHTIYQPKDPSGLKLPVIAWANGACANNGTNFAGLLGEVASHGAFLIAVGSIAGVPESEDQATGNVLSDVHPERQKAAIDWVMKFAGKGNYTHVDKTRIAVWGQSCGGIETYDNAFDKRVGSIGIFNSGQLNETNSIAFAGKVKKPIFFFLGGPDDVAYPNVSVPLRSFLVFGRHAKLRRASVITASFLNIRHPG